MPTESFPILPFIRFIAFFELGDNDRIIPIIFWANGDCLGIGGQGRKSETGEHED